MVLGLSCAIVSNLFALLTPWVLKYAIDDLTAGVTRGKLGRYAFAILAISAVGGAFRYAMRRLMIGASRRSSTTSGAISSPTCSGFPASTSTGRARAT